MSLSDNPQKLHKSKEPIFLKSPPFFLHKFVFHIAHDYPHVDVKSASNYVSQSSNTIEYNNLMEGLFGQVLVPAPLLQHIHHYLKVYPLKDLDSRHIIAQNFF